VETLWSTFDGGEDGDAPVPRLAGLEAELEPAEPTPLEVEVVRSAKRRKTVSASIVGGRVVVRMPTWMSRAQEEEYVTALVAKLERRRRSEGVDLTTRAGLLARRYELPTPTSIRFVSNQSSRWGSCTPSTGEIRISDRIAGFPTWVLDAVVVHELAHLVHLRHSPQFWELAHRYPLTERALGFLIAKQVTDDELV
jgi:predicted metal-dependent hydrolase